MPVYVLAFVAFLFSKSNLVLVCNSILASAILVSWYGAFNPFIGIAIVSIGVGLLGRIMQSVRAIVIVYAFLLSEFISYSSAGYSDFAMLFFVRVFVVFGLYGLLARMFTYEPA